MINKINNTQTKPQKHIFRTLVASLFGILALWLIFASILVVWLNRSLTDTDTYVKTVTPLVAKPEVQTYIAEKVSEALLSAAPIQDVSQTLLKPEEISGKSPEELKILVQPIISQSVTQVLSSQNFKSLWANTNRTAHAALIKQLRSDSAELTINLNPAIVGVVAELKSTRLAPVSDKIEIKPDTGNINLSGGVIEKAHKYYDLFQKATLAVVALAIFSLILCVTLSVHHNKTLRRMLIGTAFAAFVIAAAIQLPSVFSSNTAVTEQAAAIAIATSLLRSLQITCLMIGTICTVGAITFKILELRTTKQ